MKTKKNSEQKALKIKNQDIRTHLFKRVQYVDVCSDDDFQPIKIINNSLMTNQRLTKLESEEIKAAKLISKAETSNKIELDLAFDGTVLGTKKRVKQSQLLQPTSAINKSLRKAEEIIIDSFIDTSVINKPFVFKIKYNGSTNGVFLPIWNRFSLH